MRTKTGEILLILGVTMFVIGAVGLVVGFLPQNAIIAGGALAIILVSAGASIKRRAH